MQALPHSPRCLEGTLFRYFTLDCFVLGVFPNYRHIRQIVGSVFFRQFTVSFLLFCFNSIFLCIQDGLVFRIQVAYHREPQVLRESVNAQGLLIVRDNEEAQALEMATIHKPLLTSTLHG